MANVLQIGASVNVAELKAGMEEAAGQVRLNTAGMSADFKGLAAESSASVQQISSNWVRAAQATLTLKSAQSDLRSATKAAREAEDEDTASLARLAIAKREAAVAAAAMASAEQAATGATTNLGAAAVSSSLLVRGLGQDIGVGIPRFAASFIGSMEGVREILLVAFPAIAVVAIGDAIVKLIPKVQELIDSFRNVGPIQEMIAQLHKVRLELMEIASQHRKTAEIGTEGMRKASLAVRDAQADVKQYHDALAGHGEIEGEQRKLEKLQGTLDKFRAAAKDPVLAAHYAATGELPVFQTEYELKQAEERVKKQEEYVDRLRTKFVSAQEELGRAGRERTREAEHESDEVAKARIEAEHKASLAILTAREALVKEERAQGRVSIETETAVLKQAADERLAIDLKYFEARKALALREQTQTGKPAGPELTTIGADETDARIKHQSQLDAIEAHAAEERIRRSHEVAVAEIADSEHAAEARAKADEQAARESYANHKITLDQETALLVGAATAQRDAKVRANNEELAEFKKDQEKYAVQIIQTNGKIRDAEEQLQAQLAQIRAEADRKAFEEHRRAIEQEAQTELDQRRAMTQAALEHLNEEQGMSVSKANAEIAIVRNEAEQELAIVNHKEEQLRALGVTDVAEYQKLAQERIKITQQEVKQEEEIRKQEQQQFLQVYRQMTSTVFNGINEWITGQKTFAQAVKDIWNGLVLDVIKAMEQMLAKWIETHIIMALISKLFGSTDDGSAQAAAKQIATNEAVAQSDAGRAAAEVFLQAIESIPFPANVAAAPVIADHVFAQGEVYAGAATFEHGGIVPGAPGQPRMVIAHGQEMFLGSDLSQRVQNNVFGGGDSRTVHNHMTVSPVFQVNHPLTPADVDRHSRTISTAVQREMRMFNR